MPAVPYRPRYTVEDYLRWEGDWELWDGHPVSMSPAPGWNHQKLCSNLHFELETQLRASGCGDCDLFFEIDWHVDDSTVVRPDLLLVCDHPAGGKAIIQRPELVVEILSPSTAKNDLLAKRSLYETQGVPFYLILDPEDASKHEFLRLGGDGEYQPRSGHWSFEPHPGRQLEIPKELAP